MQDTKNRFYVLVAFFPTHVTLSLLLKPSIPCAGKLITMVKCEPARLDETPVILVCCAQLTLFRHLVFWDSQLGMRYAINHLTIST
jgi:hypothetical protein